MAYPRTDHNTAKILYSSLILISALYLPINSGENIRVHAAVGGDAVLPCRVDPTADHLAVEWTRTDLPPDQYVYFQRNGREFDDDKHPAYEGRTSLFEDQLKDGNMSLKLSTVTSSDQGTYACVLPEIAKTFTVQLIVDSMSAADVSEVLTGPKESFDEDNRPSVAASHLSSSRNKPDKESMPVGDVSEVMTGGFDEDNTPMVAAAHGSNEQDKAGQLGFISIGIIGIIIIIITGAFLIRKRKGRIDHLQVTQANDHDVLPQSDPVEGDSVHV